MHFIITMLMHLQLQEVLSLQYLIMYYMISRILLQQLLRYLLHMLMLVL